ncbi:MAG: rod shape-determining protein MreC [Bacteroidales bacterium]|nr:rod shape-determining protein MreC [Bacteroidales bacterium]
MFKLVDFIKRNSHVFLFILLEVLALLLVSRNSYYQGARIISWSNSIAGSYFNSVSSVTGYFGLKSENDRLAAENAKLRAQLEESYISYTDTEFEVNDTVYRQRYAYTEASVIKNSWNKDDNYIMINKGVRQGVKVDQAVMSPQGIVGVVVNTTENFSTIMPVLHSDSRNSVKVKRTNTNGTLQWEGGDFRYASVVDIPTTHKLFKGDTIITSGLANDFPEGIMVGFVEELSEIKGSGFYDVKIRLATDFNKLDHVYIIDNRFKEEQEELMSATSEE